MGFLDLAQNLLEKKLDFNVYVNSLDEIKITTETQRLIDLLFYSSQAYKDKIKTDFSKLKKESLKE